MRASDKCFYCDELVTIMDNAETVNTLEGPRPAHVECNFRAIMGSVAHIERRCGCFVAGSTETDPDGMTCREAARAAVRAWATSKAAKTPWPTEQ
jgi:hypothetical protein